MRQKPVDFLTVRQRRRLQLRNNFTNLGSFSKASVPLWFIIPCLGEIKDELTLEELFLKVQKLNWNINAIQKF